MCWFPPAVSTKPPASNWRRNTVTTALVAIWSDRYGRWNSESRMHRHADFNVHQRVAKPASAQLFARTAVPPVGSTIPDIVHDGGGKSRATRQRVVSASAGDCGAEHVANAERDRGRRRGDR